MYDNFEEKIMTRVEKCRNCKTILSDDLSYCPNCNWKKSRHEIPDSIEETIDVEETIEVKDKSKKDKSKMLKFKKEKSYQTKAKIVYILPMIFGIFLIVFAIIFASAVSYLLMAGVMNSLGGVGGAGIPMPVDIGPVDAATLSNLGIIIDMNSFGFSYTANEIQELTNSSANVLMTAMMDILGAAILIALVEIGIGIFIVFMSRKMYKRTMMR